MFHPAAHCDRCRESTAGFATRSQLLRARRKEKGRPAGMSGKIAGVSSGLVYTTDTQNQRVRELLGLNKAEQDYLKGGFWRSRVV